MTHSEARRSYNFQRISARQRGIDWHFTFAEWLAVWEASGHMADRGRGTGKYVMARRGDVGPYSVANVEIIPFEQNARDSRANHPVSSTALALRVLGKGRGWTFIKNGFQVVVGDRYVGRFRTQSDAEQAYAEAVNQTRERLLSAHSGEQPT